MTPLRALTPTIEIVGVLCGISPAFAGLSPISGQVTHVLRTRAPCAGPLYCYRRLRTRLACVKHAASVRSEPGSNSHLKLVVLKIESPDLHRDQTFRTNLLSLGSLFIPASRRSENQGSYRTGSGMYHPIVKEQAPLSCRKAYRQSESIATPCSTVKRSARRFSTSAMRLLGPGGNRFHGKTLGERQVKSCFSMRGQLGYAAPRHPSQPALGEGIVRVFFLFATHGTRAARPDGHSAADYRN